MNKKLYAAAMDMPDTELAMNRGAYFRSILGTLNHIVVGDTLWLKRFAMHPADYSALEPVRRLPTPGALDEILFEDVRELATHRETLDAVICRWADSVGEGDLDYVLRYANSKGVYSERLFFSLLMHFFNHQTHHRGQVTTLLSQAGVDVGVTDLLAMIPDRINA